MNELCGVMVFPASTCSMMTVVEFHKDCPIKNKNDIFFYIPKMVAFRVKPPARDQKDWSIALK